MHTLFSKSNKQLIGEKTSLTSSTSKILLLVLYFLFANVVSLSAQCTDPNVSLQDENQPVANPSVSYCVNIPINPAITGDPIGFSMELEHTFIGDLSIRVNACGETLMLVTRPGGGSCDAGAPFGSSASVNGYFTFSEGGGLNPDNGLFFGGGDFGLSTDPCNVNSVNSFAELSGACGSGPYTLELCITDHANVDAGFAGSIAPVFPGVPPTFCGCTNPLATNYNPNANYDDGSCIFPVFCGETFHDSGGPSSGYQNEENYTTTICPDNPDDLVEISFSVFDLQGSQDELTIFNGSNTNAPVIGIYSEGVSPGLVTSSHSSGCLTFQFVSDAEGTGDGWEAEVTCIERCSDENSTFVQTATICEGGSYEFDGQILSASGEYTATFQNFLGCDSTINLNLIVSPKIPQGFDTVELTLSSCQDADGEGLFDLETLLNEGYPNYGALFYREQNAAAIIANPGAYWSSSGVVYLRFFSAEGCVSNFIPITLEVEDGLFPPVNCAGTVCEGEIGVYTTPATTDCQPYIWEVGELGEILNGGSPADSFVVVQWNTPGEGALSLSLGGCPDAGYCPVAYRQVIPVMGAENEIIGPDIACNGTIVTYNIPSFEGTEISWTVSSGGQILAGQGTPQILVAWDAAGFEIEQIVEVEYENCVLGCEGAASIEVDVLQDLAISGRPDLCRGDSIDVTLYEIGAGTPVEGSWLLKDAFGETIADWASPTPNLVVSLDFPAGEYELVGIAENGDSFCIDRVSKNIEIYAIPPTPLGVEGDLSVCTDGNSVINAVPAGVDLETRWEIYDGTGTIRYGNQINHQWGSEMPYSLEVRHVSSEGGRCFSTPLTIELEEVPPAIISGEDINCTGDTSVYWVNSGHPNGEWEISPENACVILQSFQDSIIVEWLQPGEADVVYHLCSNSDTLDVLVSEVSKIGLLPVDTLCPDEPALIEFSQSHDTYQWYDQSDSLISTLPSPALDTGLYWLSVQNEHGCSRDTFLGVFSYPDREVIVWEGESDFCNDGFDTLFTNNGVDIIHYQWRHNGAPIGQNRPYLIVENEGAYDVVITTRDSCQFVSDEDDFNCSGVGASCDGDLIDITIDSLSECLNYLAYPYFEEEPVSFEWIVTDQTNNSQEFISTEDTISIVIEEGTLWRVKLTASFYDPSYPDSTRFQCNRKYIKHPISASFEPRPNCAEQPIQFRNTSNILPGFEPGSVSWEWDFGDPQNPDGQNSEWPYHTYATAGTFTARLTATINGCSSTVNKEVTVNPRSYSRFELPNQVCPDQPLVLEADTLLNGEHSTSYSWEQSGGVTNTLEGNTISTFLTPLDSAAIRLYTLNQFGCRDTLTKMITAPDTLGGAIQAFPALPACESDSILLSAPPGGQSWAWSDGQVTESIVTTMREQYTVEVIDSNQCSYTFGPISTDFDELPLFPVRAILYDANGDIEGYAYDSLIICEGEDVYLETLTEPPFDIEWSNGNNNTQIEFSEDRGNQLDSGIHDIFITVGSPYSSCRDTIPIRIIVSALPPTPEIISDSQGPMCEGTLFNLSVLDPLPDIIYTWQNESVGYSISSSEADLYSVTARDSLGCSSMSDTIQIHAAPNTAQVASGCLTRCRPDTLCFPELEGMTAFSWYFNGSIFSEDSLLIATESGAYQFYAESEFGCSSISEPLDLSLYDGVGLITGEVLLDLNENGMADGSDSLLSEVAIDWSSPQWGSGADTTNENGLIILPFLPAGDYQFTLNENSLNFPIVPGTDLAFDTTIIGCENTYAFTWLLDPPACVNTVDSVWIEQCAEEPYTFNGVEVYSDTSLVSSLISTEGCDSTIIANISFPPYPSLTLDTTLCHGETLEWFGTEYVMAGSFKDTVVLTGACDTIWEINLNFLHPDTLAQQFISCDGEPIQFEGEWIAPGETVLIHPNGFACDTVYEVSVQLGVIPEFSLETQSTCSGNETGELTVAISGVEASEYSLDSLQFQVDPVFNELPGGAGTVYIRSQEGCIFSESFFIDTIPVLTAWADTFSIPCPGDLVSIYPSYQITDSSWVDIIWEDGQSAPTIEVEESGTYPIIVTNGCEYFDLEIVVQPGAALEPAAVMETETLLGCLDTLELSGNLPDGAFGLWETDPASIINEPTLPSTSVIWEGIGAGWAVWSLSTEDCPSYSQDTLWLVPSPPFAASDDQLQIPADSVQSGINILANDQLPASPYTTAVIDSTYASYLSLSNGQLTVAVTDALPSSFEVPYEICLLDCPDICAEAIVRISIEQASGETEIWNGITPNGDGLNETLVFDQLLASPDEYPNNELIIFNRWGDIVFRAQPYQNDWGGTNQKGGNLPDGTYYYILRLNIGGGEVIKGDVTILR